MIVVQFQEIRVRINTRGVDLAGQVELLAERKGGSRSRRPVWVIACLPRSPPLLQVIRRDVEIMRRIIVVSH